MVSINLLVAIKYNGVVSMPKEGKSLQVLTFMSSKRVSSGRANGCCYLSNILLLTEAPDESSGLFYIV
jgi:hypothetical protein